MMHAEQQHVLLVSEAHERGAYQGPLGQIERPLQLRPHERAKLGLSLQRRPFPQLDDWEREGHRRSDHLAWQALNVRKRRAQDFVTPDDLLEALLQGHHMERPAQMHRFQQGVRMATQAQLGEEPQALLGVG